MKKISDTIERKFTNVYDASEWSIKTDTGYEPLIDVKQTIEYEIWKLELSDGRILECADDHIVYTDTYDEIFVKDLVIGQLIVTDNGTQSVIGITNTEIFENMYDVGVDSDNHRFYSNGILSHNTTCASAYLLWFAMFHPDQTILVAAHKYTGAQEIMQRIRYGYELCPDFLRAGVINYNKGSIEFENGSRIVSQTTTGTTGRGMSISLLYCLDGDTTVKIRNKETLIEEDISLQNLYTRLYNPTGNNNLIQFYSANTEYEIRTPNSWEDFEGIIFNKDVNKTSRKIIFEDGNSITATNEHRFFTNGNEVIVSNLTVSDSLDSIHGKSVIKEIIEVELENTFEIYNATNHVINANEIYSHQCDEFAYVQPNIAVEFWTSISPTLATGGRAIITSTPNSDEDQFAVIWKESQDTVDEYGNSTDTGLGRNGFFGYKADWWDHPDRDEDWKKVEIGRIGVEKFRREYNCEFLVDEETLIDSIRLSEMLGNEPKFKMGQVRWYKKPTAGNLYLAALDPSLGTGGDFGAIQVYELPSFTQVAEWQHNLTPVQGQVKIYRDILKYIQEEIGIDNTNAIYWSVENNTVGDSALVVIENLGEETFPGLFLSEPLRKGHVKKFRKGFNTTFGNKISSCARLKYLIEEDKMIINSKSLITELKSFIASGVSFKAKQGQHDDLVSSLLLVVRMSTVLAEWDQSVFDSLSIDGINDDWEAPLPFVSSYF